MKILPIATVAAVFGCTFAAGLSDHFLPHARAESTDFDWTSGGQLASTGKAPEGALSSDPSTGRAENRLTGPSGCNCAESCACCADCCSACDRWYVQAEALFLERDNRTGNRPIVLLDNNAPSQSNVLLATSDFDLPMVAGPRILLGRSYGDCSGWEISYFGLQEWTQSATVLGTNNLNLPGDLGLAVNLDFFNADQMTASYRSEIHNAEANYFWGSDTVKWLVGFRYFHLDEHFNITSVDFQTGTSQYDVRAFNDLFGAQAGLRLEGGYSCGWDWNVTGKVGIYGNASRQTQFVGDFSGFVLRDTATNGGQVAFIGEIGANLMYHFAGGHWSAIAGYNVLWVEGVALAPNQLDFTDTPTSGIALHTTGGVFFHGVNVGAIYAW